MYCPVHCRMFISGPGLSSLDARCKCSLPPTCANQICLHKLPNVPEIGGWGGEGRGGGGKSSVKNIYPTGVNVCPWNRNFTLNIVISLFVGFQNCGYISSLTKILTNINRDYCIKCTCYISHPLVS